MSSEENFLQCYNKSCGQLFDPAKNTEDSCLHHPGVPVFHDVYKKWSCCEKKTTDFTEFLNIKGCTRSYHSNIKPESQKPTSQEKCGIEEIFLLPQPLQHQEQVKRPDSNQPMEQLPVIIGSSLKPVLEKMQWEISLQKDKVKDSVVNLNTPCQNQGCHQVYKGEHSNAETCMFHSGMPVFHEGMKYWSCCVRRTTDFDSFLEQLGCTTGKHKWHKDENLEKKATCRYDWHQTGNFVVISIYSKCPIPELSYVEANPVKLHISITFGHQKNVFEEEILLYGVIDVSNSSVTYLGSKVEIKMKKAEQVSWRDLIYSERIMDIGGITLSEK